MKFGIRTLVTISIVPAIVSTVACLFFLSQQAHAAIVNPGLPITCNYIGATGVKGQTVSGNVRDIKFNKGQWLITITP